MAQIIKRKTATGENRYDVRTRIDGRVVTRTFKKRKDADNYSNTIEADKLRGVVIDPRRSRVTVTDLSKAWLASNPTKRPDTRATDDSHLRAHLIPAIGQQRISSVTPGQLQDLVNELSGRLAPKTVGRIYGVARAMFAYAVATDRLARSPCRGVKLPRVEVRARKVPSPEEVGGVAEATPAQYRAMVYLGADLGLRFSEVAGLRLGSLDLPGQALSIVETVTRDSKGSPVIGPPKSKASRRTVAVPTPLAAVLQDHVRSQALEGPGALLFTDSGGGPLRYANWRNRVWLPACRSAKVPGLGFHDLRRASATALVLDGVDLRTAGARLGHSDSRLTLELYAQVVADADRAAADSLGDRFMNVPRDARAKKRKTKGKSRAKSRP